MKEELIAYIKSELIGDDTMEMNSEDDLLTSGLIDSLAIMRFIGHIEATHEIKVAPQDMVIENFINVDAIADYIQRTKNS
ncbi:MAG: acyl carrier protein [Flavobacteriales bacterium]|nr:acyl carrier protein [Flavobacteriales bacterium]